MKALILATLLTLTAGCATAATPNWYVPQGFNLSECGPAAAAMADRWATGNNTTRFQTRATNKRGVNMFGWWSMGNIEQYLSSHGVKAYFVKTSDPLPQGAMGVYNIGRHFVNVVHIGNGKVQVGDPLNGTHVESADKFMRSVVGGAYLVVVK